MSGRKARCNLVSTEHSPSGRSGIRHMGVAMARELCLETDQRGLGGYKRLTRHANAKLTRTRRPRHHPRHPCHQLRSAARLLRHPPHRVGHDYAAADLLGVDEPQMLVRVRVERQRDSGLQSLLANGHLWWCGVADNT